MRRWLGEIIKEKYIEKAIHEIVESVKLCEICKTCRWWKKIDDVKGYCEYNKFLEFIHPFNIEEKTFEDKQSPFKDIKIKLISDAHFGCNCWERGENKVSKELEETIE